MADDQKKDPPRRQMTLGGQVLCDSEDHKAAAAGPQLPPLKHREKASSWGAPNPAAGRALEPAGADVHRPLHLDQLGTGAWPVILDSVTVGVPRS